MPPAVLPVTASQPESAFTPADYSTVVLRLGDGLRAADRMRAAGDAPGPLLACPQHRNLLVLLPAGHAAAFEDLPGSQGTGCPQQGGNRPCRGRLWLICDGAGDRLTEPGALRAALRERETR